MFFTEILDHTNNYYAVFYGAIFHFSGPIFGIFSLILFFLYQFLVFVFI